MRHVPAALPSTWQARDPEALAGRLQVAERAVGWYRRMRARPGVLAGARALSARWIARLTKAASLTQSPSGLERALEDVIVFKLSGATPQELRTIELVLHELISDLDETPSDLPRVLQALALAAAAETHANAVEAAMLTRPHRRLDEPDLDAWIRAHRAELAAETEALEVLSAFRRDAARARHGLVAVPGGRA